MRKSRDHINLLIFLLSLNTRTLGAKHQQRHSENELLADLGRERLDRPEIQHIGHDVQIYVSIKSYPVCLDLEMVVLYNKTSSELITSDNPVVLYNSWLGHGGNKSFQGISHKGLLMVFPLDTETVLLLYDKDVYRIASSQGNVAITDEQTIAEINSLQILSANNNVYFLNDEVETFAAVRRNIKHRKQESRHKIRKGSNTGDWRAEVLVQGITKPVTLGFLKLRKKCKNKKFRDRMLHTNNDITVSRNTQLIQQQIRFSELVNKGRIHLLDFTKHFDQPTYRLILSYDTKRQQPQSR